MGSATGNYDPSSLADALRRAWFFLMHGLDQGPKVAGLQIHQFWILAALQRGKRTMSDLSRVTHTTQANTTGMVSRLEKRGLVSRSHSESDRRLVEVSLTDEGHAAWLRSQDALKQRVDTIARDMTKDELLMLETLLRRIADPREE